MTQLKRNTKIVLEGRGLLTLRPGDHVATGGEGSVYRVSNTIIKLYSDSKRMKQNNMVEKIRILSGFQHEYIVSPKGIVSSESGKPIGFHMPLAEGEPMPRVFTNDFRKREGFNDKDAIILAERMREVMEFAHSKKALLIDANETNWLVPLNKKAGPKPQVIDVDSWAIGRWPASAVMLSIRDWHSKEFNRLTDWFSWGIVTFQIFTGIHPYKGKLDGYRPNEMERRMKENASVFSPKIRLNQVVRDFTAIPGPLLDWYQETFQNGLRTTPPSPLEKGTVRPIATVKRIVTTGSDMLVFDKLCGGVDQPIRIFSCGLIVLQSGALYDLSQKKIIGKADYLDAEIVKAQGGWLIAEKEDRFIRLSYISQVNHVKENLDLNIQGKDVLSYENRLFVVTEKGLTEIRLSIFNKPILSVGNTWGVLNNSTQWFDGVGIQDAMGAMYVIVPFGENACAQMRVRELDGLKSVTARAGNRFVAIICIDRNGNYQKLELTFDKKYASYQIWQGGNDNAELNLAILPKGVCATIINDGELNIFVPTTGALNRVEDKQVSTKMVLGNWENRVVYIQDREVWSLRMK